MINRVTITGADDSIQPAQLLELSRAFPFAEWAILCSQSSMGHNRFPSHDWLLTLAGFQESLRQNDEALSLSCHLCGRWVRQVLMGNLSVVDQLGATVWDSFRRVQLNTHGILHDFSPLAFDTISEEFPEKEFIFQYDDVNVSLFEWARGWALSSNFSISALFDLSHGAGIAPATWPNPIKNIYCGYAGGLGPHNLPDQLKRIEEKAGDTPVWIDMETHVRSNNDRQFDLNKVRQCLEIASQYVNPKPIKP